MRAHLDITHPAHANFLRRLPGLLGEGGHRVTISCLERGRLPGIVRELYPGMPVTVVGRYSSSRAGLWLVTGLARTLRLCSLLSRVGPDVVAGVACFQPALVGRFMGFPSVGAYDDPEHRLNYGLTRRWTDRFLVPECLGDRGGNVVTFRGLKEWAYLSPRVFRPDPSVPSSMGLEPGSYVFVRSVDTRSMNYRGQDPGAVRRLHRAGLGKRLTVLASLERPEEAEQLPGWRLIEGPVRDIHSLLYYAAAVVSSGDSMAREGAQLGVPSVYCGDRDMAANSLLTGMGLMSHVREPEEVVRFVSSEGGFHLESRESVRERLLAGWDDPTLAMRDLLTEVNGGS